MEKDLKNPAANAAREYGMITVSILIMAVGVYFFKFPNHFAFGGVTGFSAVVSEMTSEIITAADSVTANSRNRMSASTTGEQARSTTM